MVCPVPRLFRVNKDPGIRMGDCIAGHNSGGGKDNGLQLPLEMEMEWRW